MQSVLTRISPQRNGAAAAMLMALFCVSFADLAAAQVPTLTPEPLRKTDEAQYHDQTVYQVMEQRLKGLNERGHMLSDYDMAKAQCWVDVSFHEYSRNDRSAFPDQSLAQAETIIESLENNQTPGRDTPLINDATRLRPDLWKRLDEIKSQPALVCAAQAVACAEVELVHAGSEYHQFGWRHANPYVEIAEDMVADANQSAEHCTPPPPPPPGGLPAAQTPSVRVDRTTLRADALFAFKKFELSKAGQKALDEMIAKIPKGQPLNGVAVVGFTDRIDVHHDPRRNQRLSEERAKSVADYLGKHGVDASKITAYGRASANPVVECDDKDKAKLYACLAPNRRVEVVVTGVAVVK